MNPDPSEGWIFDGNGRAKQLKKDQDSSGKYFIIPRNSFVFIRLRQKLRMPFYLIGRFNLKIRYVYRGLLLGTGPQIDPGYTGRIYIPLHNFTNEPVNIYVDTSFVSFEFERTSPIRLTGKNPATVGEFYDLYQDSLRLIDPRKIKDRDNLEAYLDGAHPYSALGVLVEDLGRMRSQFQTRKWIDWALVIGIAAVVVAYAASTYSLFDSTRNREAEIEQHIYKASEDQIEPVTRLQVQMSTLLKEIQQLAADVQKLKKPGDPTSTPSTQPTAKQ